MSRSESEREQFLVIAAIFKAENLYLREWLEFHLLVGVDHFYLYDNDGGEEAAALLKPYEEGGFVTRHPWTHVDGTKHDRPTPLKQRNKNHMAFGHCAENYRDRFEWVMKIDIDEFLVPSDGAESLVPALQRYTGRPVKGIRLPRFNFGDSGHRTRPEGLVCESYLRREEVFSDHKDLGNGRFLDSNRRCNSAHSWSHRTFKRGRIVRERDVDGLRVHHYYTKSLEEYLVRQNMSLGRGQSEEDFKDRNRGANAIGDATMLRFAPELKRRLAQP